MICYTLISFVFTQSLKPIFQSGNCNYKTLKISFEHDYCGLRFLNKLPAHMVRLVLLIPARSHNEYLEFQIMLYFAYEMALSLVNRYFPVGFSVCTHQWQNSRE